MKNSLPNYKSSKSFLGAWTALSIATIAALATGGFTVSRSASADAPPPTASSAPAAATPATGAPAITLTSDAFPGKTYALTITQDAQGVIQQFTYQTDTGSTTVTVASIEQAPQVLFKQDGHNIVFLSADPGFDPQKGGFLELKFMTNVLTGGYKDFRIDAEIQGNDIVLRSDPNLSDSHSDKNKYTSVFDQLFFKKASFGISAITPSES